MKRNRKYFLAALLLLPLLSVAADGQKLVKCGTGGVENPTTGLIDVPYKECTYNDLVTLVQDYISYLVYYLATPIAVLLFGVAGFKLITSGGNPAELTTAKTIFKNTLIGYVVMLSAYLIVKLIFQMVFPSDGGYLLLN